MQTKSSHHHHQHPHQYSGKQEDVKWCCCPLHSLVTTISILLISIYLVSITVATIIWVLHSETKDLTAGTVVEVNSLDELLDEASDESENNFDIILIILVVTIIVSIIGILTTIILILAVTKRSSMLMLPWLIWHMGTILGSVASGLYLVIYFLLLLEERNVTNAILSLIPILSGIFLIFPWVLVDQLYVKYKQTKIIIEMNNPITRSISSLSIRPGGLTRSQSQLNTNTVRSNTNMMDTLRSNKSNKSRVSARSVRSVKKRNDLRRHNQFHFRPDVMSRKSRSLEHILDNSSSSSSGTAGSSFDHLAAAGAAGLTTLPRLRRCEDVPGMWRAAYNSDTMRSCKSVGSIKSVQISNRVTEFHYSDSENERTVNHDDDDFNDEDFEAEVACEDPEYPLPTPVYPTLNSKKSWKLADKKNSFTKDQIIDLYCASTIDR